MTFARTFALLALPLLHAVNAASAQPIDGRQVPAVTDTFMVSYAGNVIGRGITARSVAGSSLLQVYRWESADGDWTMDSLFSDVSTLRSLRQSRVVRDTLIAVRFRGDSSTVTLRPSNGSPQVRALTIPTEAFSSAILDALISASPLATGYESNHHFYYAPPAPYGTIPIHIRVMRSEDVFDRRGARRPTWVVEASTPSGGTTYWIDKATRTVIRFDTREGPAVIEFRRPPA
jgi:hypothetical protein